MNMVADKIVVAYNHYIWYIADIITVKIWYNADIITVKRGNI